MTLRERIEKRGDRAELRPCPSCKMPVIHNNGTSPHKYPCAWCGVYHSFKLDTLTSR